MNFLFGVDDDTEELPIFTQEEWDKIAPAFKPTYSWSIPICDCGGWKTYGETNNPEFHADYCSLKKR